jgi:hypothetical protein
MLALPGTSLDMTFHTNGISQARLLNFNILKGIYMGNMKEAGNGMSISSYIHY